MGLFDDEIQLRRRYDNEAFETSFLKIASSLQGSSEGLGALFNSSARAQNAVSQILDFYGVKNFDGEIDENWNENIVKIFASKGIVCRQVNLEKGWRRDAYGAMLLKRCNSDAYVAMIPDKGRGYTFMDYESGKEMLLNAKNEGDFELSALCFYRSFPNTSLNLKDLFSFALSEISSKECVAMVLFTLFFTILGLLIPKVSYFLLSSVVSAKSFTLLLSTVFFFVCLGCAKLLFEAAENLLNVKIAEKMKFSVQAACMIRLLSLPVGFFKKYPSGDLNMRIQNMGILCSELFNSFFSTFIRAVFSLLFITQILNFANALLWPSLLIVTFTTATIIGSMVLQVRVTRRWLRAEIAENGLSYALISGVQKIRLAGAEKRAFAKWADWQSEKTKVLYNPPALIKFNSTITVAVMLVGTLILYFVAVKNHVGVAEYFAFNAAFGVITMAFIQFSETALSIARSKPQFEMIEPFMRAVPEVFSGCKQLSQVRGSFEFSNVYFRYGESCPWVIEGCSLKFKAKEYVAIVGKTGCGKSTLMRLILGFEKPARGAVYFDGRDLNSLDLKMMRQDVFGIVLQNGKLVTGSIYDNICIASPGLSMDDAWEAAETAGLADDIREMPMGMFTMVHEGGNVISGGQKQRLLIARAIASKPKVLLLDEATSALDNVTQKKVADALAKMNCTRIVIAHRLSTVKNCDRIIVFDGGRVVEEGCYDALIEKNGFFADLVKRQRIDA